MRLHLAQQTANRISLFDLPSLLAANTDSTLDDLLQARPDGILFDGINEARSRLPGVCCPPTIHSLPLLSVARG